MICHRTVGCWLLITVSACSLSGCATIVSGNKGQVTLDNSGGATYFSILDSKDRVVDSGVTPKQVTLKTSRALFKPAKYRVVYASQDGVEQHDLDASVNWWTAGNIIIGGVPGVAIDAATGAVWKLQPRVIGHVPSQHVVSNASQGASLLAAHSGIGAVDSSFTASDNLPNNVRQTSFESRKTAEQESRVNQYDPDTPF